MLFMKPSFEVCNRANECCLYQLLYDQLFYRVYQKKVYGWKKSAIFCHNTNFFYLRWLGIKSHFLKSAHKAFLFKTGFEQMVLKYGILFIRLQSFRHFGASTINIFRVQCTKYGAQSFHVTRSMISPSRKNIADEYARVN